MRLPVFLSQVALAVAVAITAGCYFLLQKKNIVPFVLTAGRDEI